MLRRAVRQKFTDNSQVLAASIIREARRPDYEPSGNFHQTSRRNNPDGSHVRFEIW
jgi:hypothetical protein